MSQNPSCPKCWKDLSSCICSEISPVNNRIAVLILQHPQESRSPWTTSRLLALGLKNSTHLVGFSWRSLRVALKKEVDPKKWAVLFVGTDKNAKKVAQEGPLALLDRKGNRANPSEIEGIVVLDGTWKQSKTLWWRNPWLLKLNRIVLNTDLKSLYGSLRKEPREGLLSTLEATGLALEHLGESVQTREYLFDIFSRQIEAWKKLQ